MNANPIPYPFSSVRVCRCVPVCAVVQMCAHFPSCCTAACESSTPPLADSWLHAPCDCTCAACTLHRYDILPGNVARPAADYDVLPGNGPRPAADYDVLPGNGPRPDAADAADAHNTAGSAHQQAEATGTASACTTLYSPGESPGNGTMQSVVLNDLYSGYSAAEPAAHTYDTVAPPSTAQRLVLGDDPQYSGCASAGLVSHT